MNDFKYIAEYYNVPYREDCEGDYFINNYNIYWVGNENHPSEYCFYKDGLLSDLVNYVFK